MQTDDTTRLQQRLRTGFVLAVALIAIFVIWTASGFRTAARLFPLYAAWATLGFCALELGRQALQRVRGAQVSDAQGVDTADIGVEAEEMGLDGLKRGLGIYAWVLGYGALILALGMQWATVIFVPALLHLRFRSDWRVSLGIVVGLLALMWALRSFLGLRLPPGLVSVPFLF